MRAMINLALLVAACGGEARFAPEGVDRAASAVERAYRDGDEAGACRALGDLMPGLYEWQENARGNRVVAVAQVLQLLGESQMTCGAAKFPGASWEQAYAIIHVSAKGKAGWSTFLKWGLGFGLIFGVAALLRKLRA